MTPPIDETCMMCPRPAPQIGSAAWVTHNAPNRLVSICARASASLTSSIMPNRP